MEPLVIINSGDVLTFEKCELIDAIRVEVIGGDETYICTDLTRDEAATLRGWLTAWLASAPALAS